MAQTVEITAETRAAASEEADLPLMQTVLLGTMHGPDGPRALVRTSFGGIETVSVGTRLSGGKVTAIDESALYLSRNGQAVKMTIPGS